LSSVRFGAVRCGSVRSVQQDLQRTASLAVRQMAARVVGPSWDDVDEVALLQIAPRHKKRRITNGNVRTHQTDWVNVANEFNAVANVQRSSEALRNRWIRLNKWHSATDGPSSTVLAAELTGSDSLTAEDNAQQSDVQGEEMSGALGEEAAAEVMAEEEVVMDAFPTSSTDTLRPHDLSQPETLQHRLSALPRSTVLTHQLTRVSLANRHCNSRFAAACRARRIPSMGHIPPMATHICQLCQGESGLYKWIHMWKRLSTRH